MSGAGRVLVLILAAIPALHPPLTSAPAAPRTSLSLQARLERAGPEEELVVWVYFSDRGFPRRGELAVALRAREQELPPETLRRRRRACGPGAPLVSEDDLPVFPGYAEVLEEAGATLRVRSRWLNAVSIKAIPAVIEIVAGLPFVSRIDLVRGRIPFSTPPRGHTMDPSPVPGRPLLPGGAARDIRAPASRMDYGESWAQNVLIQVPYLHEAGLSGRDVRIGVLDSGFDLSHGAFGQLRVLSQWDFIHADSITAYQEGQDSLGQDFHGTQVLSVLAGYAPGHLIGPAFGADFLLAKTEEVSSERPAEEDWWVAGIEWAEAAGADIVSSSLGYLCMDDPLEGYTYEDMDGDTAVTTKVADRAVRLGVFVATAVGNFPGRCGDYMHPISPADGDSVAAVGAVTAAGERASFSAVGPTYDGRIKPDLMAPGSSVWSVTPGVEGAYVTSSGTSMATPLVAGVAALILESRRTSGSDWTGIELLDTLRATATRADRPDTLFGWGVVRPARVLGIEVPADGEEAACVNAAPNPFRLSTEFSVFFPWSLSPDTSWNLSVYDLRGRRIRDLARGRGGMGFLTGILWRGDDDAGRALASGVYFVRLDAGSQRHAAKVVLLR